MDTETISLSATNAFVAIITSIVSTIATLLTLYIKSRLRQPTTTKVEDQPIGVKVARDFVLKSDFERHADENKATHNKIFELIGTSDRENATNYAGVSRQLGNIEGQLTLLIDMVNGKK